MNVTSSSTERNGHRHHLQTAVLSIFITQPYRRCIFSTHVLPSFVASGLTILFVFATFLISFTITPPPG